jgi:hypothetical protein
MPKQWNTFNAQHDSTPKAEIARFLKKEIWVEVENDGVATFVSYFHHV